MSTVIVWPDIFKIGRLGWDEARWTWHFHTSVRTWVWIPNIHRRLGTLACICILGAPTVRWEVETGECSGAHRPPACKYSSRETLSQTSGGQGPTPKGDLWPPYVCHGTHSHVCIHTYSTHTPSLYIWHSLIHVQTCTHRDTHRHTHPTKRQRRSEREEEKRHLKTSCRSMKAYVWVASICSVTEQKCENEVLTIRPTGFSSFLPIPIF